MKITFVYPDLYPNWEGTYTGQYYVGIAILSAVLKEAGYETSLIHVYNQPRQETFLKKLKDGNPDLIGFSTTTHMFPLVQKMSSWIKDEKINVPIICGGVHPTLDPENTISHDPIDMVCIGEAENALVELCNAMAKGKNYKNIPSIWVKEGKEIFKSPPRCVIQDIDKLPFPDIDLFDYANLTMEKEGWASFLGTRGCPFNCTYCSNHALKQVYTDSPKYTRKRSVDNIIAEIKPVLARYPNFKRVDFQDDILMSNKEWGREFAEKYNREIGLPFDCSERVNYMDDELAALLKKAGCDRVRFGIESGSDHVRRNILNRKMSQDSIKKAIGLCNKHGMKVLTYNIIGLPFETPKNVLETIKLNAEMDVDVTQHTIFFPYIGTRLYEVCKENGFLTNKTTLGYFSESILKLNTITSDQILNFNRYFDHIVRLYRFLYKRPYTAIFVKILDIVWISPIFQLLCSSFINPMHDFYRKYLKPKSEDHF